VPAYCQFVVERCDRVVGKHRKRSTLSLSSAVCPL
jgi:hypothetical protein